MLRHNKEHSRRRHVRAVILTLRRSLPEPKDLNRSQTKM
jgi:hypothetical protein